MSQLLKPTVPLDFAAMNAQFAESPLSHHDENILACWRPPGRSLWRLLQPVMGTLAACQTDYRRVDGHRICYWTAGRGKEALLLLHGFGSSKENWAFLASRLAGYRLLVPDLPGFGLSEFRHDADYSLIAQADRIAALLSQEEIAHCHVVGSSMGGAIAALLASRHPDKVKSLTLMNAAGMPAERMSLLASGLYAGTNPLAPATRRDTWKVFAICLHRRRRALGAFLSIALAGEMSHRKVVNDFLFSRLITSQQDTFDCLSSVAAPTLVLWGDADQVLDRTCVAGFCRQIPHARAVVLPEVGHLPMLEVPGQTASVLTEFWRSV